MLQDIRCSTELDRRRFIRGAQGSIALLAAGSAGVLIPGAAGARSALTEAGLSVNATPRQVAESYWRAEGERSVEKVGWHFHRNAIFIPPGGPPLVGWDAMSKWFEGIYEKFRKVHVEIVHAITQGSEGCFEFQATLSDVNGNISRPVGVNIMRVSGGKFEEVRAYFDSSVAC